MIRSEFVIQDNKILSFSIRDHAGLAPAPFDVLCASVSAMSLLVINTLKEVFHAKLDLVIDEETPLIRLVLQSFPPEEESAVQGILRGLLLQLQDLAEQYPDHLTVRTKS